jgi:bifunctional non-homologous end joining protein LigD
MGCRARPFCTTVRALRLPEPMLSRPGPLPTGTSWSFELKWDGFRAIVSTEDGLHVRSRRGWNMTSVLPELRQLPEGVVLDGELVAWRGREPHFPLVCRRVLNRDHSVPLTFVVFDLLRLDGTDLSDRPYSERRSLLGSLDLHGPGWTISETFDDGHALYTAVCEHGLEGVVAKKLSGRYRPGERGWVKIKNPNYWRRDAEREAVARIA